MANKKNSIKDRYNKLTIKNLREYIPKNVGFTDLWPKYNGEAKSIIMKNDEEILISNIISFDFFLKKMRILRIFFRSEILPLFRKLLKNPRAIPTIKPKNMAIAKPNFKISSQKLRINATGVKKWCKDELNRAMDNPRTL